MPCLFSLRLIKTHFLFYFFTINKFTMSNRCKSRKRSGNNVAWDKAFCLTAEVLPPCMIYQSILFRGGFGFSLNITHTVNRP